MASLGEKARWRMAAAVLKGEPNGLTVAELAARLELPADRHRALGVMLCINMAFRRVGSRGKFAVYGLAGGGGDGPIVAPPPPAPTTPHSPTS